GVAELLGDVLQSGGHFGDVHGRVRDAFGVEVGLGLVAVPAVRLGVDRVRGGHYFLPRKKTKATAPAVTAAAVMTSVGKMSRTVIAQVASAATAMWATA